MSRGILVDSRASTVFSSDVSEKPSASDLRVIKSVHVDVKVIGLYLTGKFNGIRPITAMDEEGVKVLIPSLRELS
jgi:hypothetical protein